MATQSPTSAPAVVLWPSPRVTNTAVAGPHGAPAAPLESAIEWLPRSRTDRRI